MLRIILVATVTFFATLPALAASGGLTPEKMATLRLRLQNQQTALLEAATKVESKEASRHLVSVELTASIAKPGDRMPTLRKTTQPVGHWDYCRKHRADCNITSTDTRPVYLTQKRMDELNRINAAGNRKLRSGNDAEIYPNYTIIDPSGEVIKGERWVYPEYDADCEDFVLWKRHELMKRGWPASALLITVVTQTKVGKDGVKKDVGHAVLTVRTHRYDLVLDNLQSNILPWNQTEYRFVKRQSPSFSGHWEDLRDNRVLVTAGTN